MAYQPADVITWDPQAAAAEQAPIVLPAPALPRGVLGRGDDAAQLCAAAGITAFELAQLRDRASAAKAAAYCPYSRFRVGAALLTKGGEFVAGANVENASYPVGTCAERVALATAVVAGLHHAGFKALAVATDIAPAASPCGMCRQFIREFSDLNLPILMFDKNENLIARRLEELLPLSFGPEALPPPNMLP